MYLIFFEIFLVSGKSHSAEKGKRRTLWEYLNIHFFAKIEGGPLETFKKFAKKSLTKLKYSAQKVFGQFRDSNTLPFAWQTSKYQNIFKKSEAEEATLVYLSFFEIFLVSGKSHSAEKGKRGTFWEFLNIHSFAKIEGGTLEKFKKFAKKSLTKPN